MLDMSYPLLAIPRSGFFKGSRLVINYTSPEVFTFALSYDCDNI